MKHRGTLRDLGILGLVMLVMTYLAFEYDIFRSEGQVSPVEQTIELDEALLLGGLLALGLLVFAVRRYYAQQREIVRRIAAEQAARQLAYQDPLTGLANRRQFQEALDQAVASLPRAGAVHAVLLLDLNGFKQINDTHGHAIGDEVLLTVAQRLLLAARQSDLVARLGGDEYVILALHLSGPDAAASIALRIIQQLEAPIATGNLVHRVGTGVGIALIPVDATAADEALRKADVALYRAKELNASRFCFFEIEMDRHVRERDQLEQDLRLALDHGTLDVRFQPSFDLRSGRVVGFEATPSWVVDGAEVPLARYLAVAEEAGLVTTLARHVLRRACAAAATWPGHITLSLDLLPGQLGEEHLAPSILEVIAAAGIAPQRLELEISEHMIVQDLQATRSALQPLRAAGVKIAIDHFGTGYSSLYHMREFRIDKVKIDRRFIEDLGEESSARTVKALAGLGDGLGFTVSADGLSDASAAPLLRSGVREGQSASQFVSGEETRGFFAAPPTTIPTGG